MRLLVTHGVGNLVQLHDFPTRGKKNRKGKYEQGTQITYTCQEPAQFASLFQGKGKCAGTPGLAAYRMIPSAYENIGWAIMFCPLFFRKTYLNRLTDQKARPVEELQSLVTYEHILAHEILHCDIIGVKSPIVDMNGNIPGQRDNQPIYGASRCHEWAWAYNRGPLGPVNIQTALNADNYVWFLTNRWFDKHWKWNEYVGGNLYGDSRDGSWIHTRQIHGRQDEEDQDDGTNPIDKDDLSEYPEEAIVENTEYPGAGTVDVGAVPNCRTEGDDKENDVYCDYVGELYDDYLDNVDESFLSEGNCTLS